MSDDSRMPVSEALGIAAHLRKHALPDADDQSISARQTRTVVALANEVERLRGVEAAAREAVAGYEGGDFGITEIRALRSALTVASPCPRGGETR